MISKYSTCIYHHIKTIVVRVTYMKHQSTGVYSRRIRQAYMVIGTARRGSSAAVASLAASSDDSHSVRSCTAAAVGANTNSVW